MKTHSYFKHSNINMIFCLNISLFYMQNTVKYLHRIRCAFYVRISTEAIFYVSIWESPYDKILKTRDYFQHININVMLLFNIFFILYIKHSKIFTSSWLWILWTWIEIIDIIFFWKLIIIIKTWTLMYFFNRCSVFIKYFLFYMKINEIKKHVDFFFLYLWHKRGEKLVFFQIISMTADLVSMSSMYFLL